VAVEDVVEDGGRLEGGEERAVVVGELRRRPAGDRALGAREQLALAVAADVARVRDTARKCDRLVRKRACG